MKLASILNPALIFFGVEGSTREEIYGAMLKKAQGAIREKLDATMILGELIEREDSLAMPYDGLALPHARIPGLRDLYIIIGVPACPVTLKADDFGATKLIVLSLISDDASASYLKALAAFVRYLAKPGNIDLLASMKSGSELIARLAADNVLINKTITAEDVMSPCTVVRADDSLADALDVFHREGRQVLPVVDADGKLVGQISSPDIIKSFIPDYVFMMENLNFLSSFEIFENIFKTENHHKVSEYMHPVKMELATGTPLIQFTIRLLRNEARSGFVVSKEGHLLGRVDINSIVHKVLRG